MINYPPPSTPYLQKKSDSTKKIPAWLEYCQAQPKLLLAEFVNI